MLNKLKRSILHEVCANKDYLSAVNTGLNGPLRYYYWKETPNFGDQLMPLIVGHFFPDIKLKAVTADNAEILGVGSILTTFNKWRFKHLFYNGSKNFRIFWGSGMLMPDKDTHIPNSNIVLARGKLSKKYMKIPNEIVLGDPGLIMSLVIPREEEKSKVIIIPHFKDYNNEKLTKFKEDIRFEIIDVRDNPENIIKKISSASLVLSSSLHGLIIADSYKVPNALYNISGTMNFFKYDDYYSITGREKMVIDDSVNLLDRSTLSNLKKMYQPIINLEQIQSNIIKSFPFQTMNDVVEWRKTNQRAKYR